MDHDNNPCVSLCIPTNGVVEWVFPVLDSIYEQGVDEKLFEVIVTDNGENENFSSIMGTYCSRHSNLLYAKTKAALFSNQIEAIKRASGQFIKFVNHRSRLREGVLSLLIEFSRNYFNTKPTIYFSNGVLSLSKDVHCFETFNQFVCALEHYSSWSAGLSLWKDDSVKLPIEIESYNKYFPHTTILFAEKEKGQYIIDNRILFSDIDQGKTPKGNYDLFKVFGVEYPQVIEELFDRGDITKQTYDYVLLKNLDFIASLVVSYRIRKLYCSYDLSGYDRMFGAYYSRNLLMWRILVYLQKEICQKIRKFLTGTSD